jgi:hypothetical protein
MFAGVRQGQVCTYKLVNFMMPYNTVFTRLGVMLHRPYRRHVQRLLGPWPMSSACLGCKGVNLMHSGSTNTVVFRVCPTFGDAPSSLLCRAERVILSASGTSSACTAQDRHSLVDSMQNSYTLESHTLKLYEYCFAAAHRGLVPASESPILSLPTFISLYVHLFLPELEHSYGQISKHDILLSVTAQGHELTKGASTPFPLLLASSLSVYLSVT